MSVSAYNEPTCCLSDSHATFRDPSRQTYLQHDCEVSLGYQHCPHSTCPRRLCEDSFCVRHTAHVTRLLTGSIPQTVTHTLLENITFVGVHDSWQTNGLFNGYISSRNGLCQHSKGRLHHIGRWSSTKFTLIRQALQVTYNHKWSNKMLFIQIEQYQ